MNAEVFEQLLYEEESATLDFKKEQYLFVKATEQEKSELLKDILGFANAWRRSEAYIIIGVEDVRGGRANVTGISAADHLDDHSLQQFVNNLTNRPVRFHYEAFGFENKQVGIIRIEDQTRPIYLRRGYGRLVKGEVYVRRGSSTDPSKPASPDEIAQMRTGLVNDQAEVTVEFAEIERDEALGSHLVWSTELCEMPPRKSIPDYTPPRRSTSFGMDLSFMDYSVGSRVNTGYYRELAEYELARRLFRPIRLAVKNTGQVAASNVRVEIAVPIDEGPVILRDSRMPERPKTRNNYLLGISPTRNVQPILGRRPGATDILKNEEVLGIEIECGHLQPGRSVWSDVLYVGNPHSGDVVLGGRVLADNLPQPKDIGLTISFTVTKTVMGVDELCSFSPSLDDGAGNDGS